MPNKGDRGGARTRAHIAEIATELFIRRGFDAVTVAEVAAAAGVSKVTVFKYFERKEDLLLDRLPDAVELVRSAVRDRPPSTDVVDAIRQLALDLRRRRHPLSGLAPNARPAMETIAAAPALIARLREFEHDVERALADELAADDTYRNDAELAAALLVAAYRTVAIDTVRRLRAGASFDAVAAKQRQVIERAFGAVAHGLAAR